MITQLIAVVTGTIGAEDIRPGDRLHEDLGMDSLEMADLLTCVEDEYGAVITASMLADIRTVAELESVVRRAACA